MTTDPTAGSAAAPALADAAIVAQQLGKTFVLYEQAFDRLKQFLWRGKKKFGREFKALENVSFTLPKGEVLGIIGRNGAGKSTLLQLVCGTLTPSAGNIQVRGRISALLELGAGFNPEFSGRENIYLNASVLGLTRAEIDARYESIVDFSGIRDFIDQPVKTYSSGMYMRLAFSIATSIDPDILVIDEALSVGDGEFARRSFDRIIELKKKGATVLFCSHSMYHIESLCQQALWLHRGAPRAYGPASEVVKQYNHYLLTLNDQLSTGAQAAPGGPLAVSDGGGSGGSGNGAAPARLLKLELECEGQRGQRVLARSGRSDVTLWFEIALNPGWPAPSLVYEIHNRAGLSIHSAASTFDGFALPDGQSGVLRAGVTLEAIPLMPDEYSFTIYLGCENVLHVYDAADHALWLDVEAESARVTPGMVNIRHRWHGLHGSAAVAAD